MKKIEKWLEANTFHHGQFWDLLKLIELKEKQGLTISLCIPTLNEEQTIGKEIVIFRSELMERYPLIDEFAVIDSGSSDRTREVAASYGADVYLAADILPSVGDKRGKGENLWKAIHQLKGDIICYVDADIKNIHPRFVYGLVAPLIHRQEVHYVKAFYDRPMAYSSGIRPSGGGRVTEILVRPLFSLFFPELTALIQPLSGGIRRAPQRARTHPVPHRLRGRDVAHPRCLRPVGARSLRPDRPRPTHPPQPDHARTGQDVLRHPPKLPHSAQELSLIHISEPTRPY